jgi:hypothetical protein
MPSLYDNIEKDFGYIVKAVAFVVAHKGAILFVVGLAVGLIL